MIEFLRTLLAEPQVPPRGPGAREAVAALLVEAARADGDYDPGEAAAIERFLSQMFGVDRSEASVIRIAGEEAQAIASDVVRFTRVVKTELGPEERIRLLEALWSVVLSDGERDPHEDALLRKLAPLIALTDRESASARQRAAETLGAAPPTHG